MKTVVAIVLALAIAVPATWFLARRDAGHAKTKGAQTSAERKPIFYQSAMHPWIKSEKPGRCTICGMELTPVYEGEAGFDPAGGEIVSLSQNTVHVMNVQTAEVKKRPITRALIVAGTIDDNQARHRVLSAYIPGRIEKLYVNYVGAEVKEGEPLAEFYSPALLQSEREYRTLSGELREGIGLRLRQMGLTPEQIEAIGKKPGDKLTSQILAPIGGTVVSQNVYEGQYVQEGERLFEIADFSTMWFQFPAYEQDLPWIKLGQKVEVTTPSAPGKVFEGKIAFIDPNLDEATRATTVRVELENPIVDGRRLLLHRLYADGRIQLDAPEAVALPRSAIVETGPQAVAYVEKESGSYERRVVKLGRRGDEFVQALSGVEEGERVVVSGNLLIDGQAEMNRGFSQTMHEETSVKISATPLSDAEKEAVAAFVQANDAISSALAKDDLAGFNAAGPGAMPATEKLAAAFKGRAEMRDILSHVAEAQHLHGAKDLAAARKAFHPFANASAKALELLEHAEGAPAFQVFECPMVDQAIAGAPKRGRWVQAEGRGLANPYFGAAMLECGKRIFPQGGL